MAEAADVSPAFDAQDRPQIIEHLSKGLNYTVFDAKWIPSSARFVVLGQRPRGTGSIQVYQMGKQSLDVTNEAEKEAAFKCGTFGASSLEERRLATGDFNGRMSIWDLERMGAPTYTVKAHSSIINAIDGCGGLNVGAGAQEIVTGGRDGQVHVWDPRVPDEAVASLKPKSGEDVRDCWAVTFGNAYNEEERVVAAGYDNGDIKLFDLKMNRVRWETNVKNGVCNVEFDRKDIEMNKLLVCGLESQFRVYDMRTYNEKKGYTHLQQKAHNSTVWTCKHLKQNRDIWASCGGDGSINIFKYSYPSQRAIKDGDGNPLGVAGTVEMVTEKKLSTQPICCFDWSGDKEGLCVYGSFDQTIRVGIVTRLHTLR